MEKSLKARAEIDIFNHYNKMKELVKNLEYAQGVASQIPQMQIEFTAEKASLFAIIKLLQYPQEDIDELLGNGVIIIEENGSDI